MAFRDLANNVKFVQLVSPIVVNNDTEGGNAAAGLDTKGFDSATLITEIGVSGDTLSGTVYHEVVIEDSDDDSTYAAVSNTDYVLIPDGGVAAAPDANGVVATINDPAEDPAIVVVGYVGPKRYVRARIETTGTHTNGTPASVLGMLGHPSIVPVDYS